MSEDESDFWTTKQLARKYGVSPRTLERWRGDGTGPPFTKKGKTIRYPKRKAQDWWDKHTSTEGK